MPLHPVNYIYQESCLDHFLTHEHNTSSGNEWAGLNEFLRPTTS